MKQILQSYRSGELDLVEAPPPVCQDNGVLVRVSASLVSAGTEKMLVDLAKKSLIGKAMARPDLARQVFQKMRKEGVRPVLEKVFTKLDNPIPLGYSCVGRVIETGRNVTRLKVGDRVACGGAGYANHAEVDYVPQNLAVKLPDGIDEEAAAFATVGSIAMQGVRQAEVELGHRVGVIGLGLLGQLTVQILKASGAKVICMDISEKKMELARELGADWAIHTDNFASIAKNVSDGQGLDSLIITASTSSNAPIELAGEVCRYKGKVVVVGMVGMDIPRNDYYKKELDIRLSMSYGPGRYDANYEEKGIDYPYSLVRWSEGRNMQTFLELCREGKVTPGRLVTHRFPFEEALKAYELFENKAGEPYLGILLKYDTGKPLETRVSLPQYRSAPAGRIRLGLVGAGNFAKAVLLPRLAALPGFTLAALSTATGVSARGTADKYRIPSIHSDAAGLIAGDEVDAVVIATRHDLHGPQVLASLASGKHVFVEKPLCIREEELDAIRSAQSGPGARPVLMVGFNRRFSSHARRLRDWVEASGENPFIRYCVNAGAIPGTSWIQDPEVGGGRIVGEACHFVDLCAYLAGSPVAEVFATCLDTPGDYHGDNVSILLVHRSGARSSIDYLANGDTSLPKERVEVFCAGGVAACEDFSETRFVRRGRKSAWKSKGVDKGFQQELEAFALAVAGKEPPPIALESLLNTTAATFRALESIATGIPARV
jgi:predicted dehydrogenase/threonine dehydrogenase-like Zn-dependent dehydrogenase